MNPHLKTLEQAEAHFRQGQFIDGAKLVRKAAYGAIADAASANGDHADQAAEAYAFAIRLDQPDPENPYQYALRLDVADLYLEQAAAFGKASENNADWQWEPDDFTERLSGIQRMIASLA